VARVPTLSHTGEEQVLAHVHIPKCAGTSVRVWLYRAFPDAFGSWYPNYVFDAATLEAAGLGDYRLRALSTHSIRRFEPVSCGRTMRYFTLLRNPVEHVISTVRYICQLQHEAHPSAPLPTVRDIVAVLLRTPGIYPFWDNIQTNFLALYPWCEGEGARFSCDPLSLQTWSQEALDAYLSARLRIAKDVLRSFVTVGTVERIIESLELVRFRSAQLGFELMPPHELTMENVTQVMNEDHSWVATDDVVGRRFLAFMKEDQALYAFAEHLLDEGREAVLAAR
jgi:hypothetical protein